MLLKRWRGRPTDATGPGQEASSSNVPGAEADVQTPGQVASSTNVPGEAVPLASEAEKEGKFYQTEELAIFVAAGVKQALAELAAATKDAGGTVFGVSSLESSKDAEEFKNDIQKFMEEQSKTAKALEAQAQGLASAAAKFKDLEEEFRATAEKERMVQEEQRLAQREEERARQAAADLASQNLMKEGQERLAALQERMLEEISLLKEARTAKGLTVPGLTEATLL